MEIGKLGGWPAPDKRASDAQAAHHGAYDVGDPDSVAERIVNLHGHTDHTRHFLQMDVGNISHEIQLKSVRLLATEVNPRIAPLLAAK